MKSGIVIGILFILALVAGCVRLTDSQGRDVPVVKSGDTLVAEMKGAPEQLAEKVKMRAMVKGSIYKTGEITTVFATCLDEYDHPVPNITGFLSAWYPNGTAYLVNQTMIEMQPGYFYRTQPMDAVQGTYLTEFRCLQNMTGLSAYAWGEWQNPVWTNEIDQLNMSVADVYALLLNISQNGLNVTVTGGNFSIIGDWFNITWDKLDQMNVSMAQYYANITQQITYVGQIANASVDRNDSYLAELILNINSTCSTCQQSGNPVNHTESYGDAVYRKDWTITVQALSPIDGKKLRYPDVLCDIATSLTPGPTAMEPQGTLFTYTEYIGTKSPFTWNVSCVYS